MAVFTLQPPAVSVDESCMSKVLESNPGTILADIFAPFPRMDISLGDDALYKRFRCLEPALVSCLDDCDLNDASKVDYLAVSCEGQPAGVASLVVRTNDRRALPDNMFGRIDLVIVAPNFRGRRLGRLLTLCSIVHLLNRFGPGLYSISCLAAHVAMEKILESVAFIRSERQDSNFVHEELSLDHATWRKARSDMQTEAIAAARAADFRIRQSTNNLRA